MQRAVGAEAVVEAGRSVEGGPQGLGGLAGASVRAGDYEGGAGVLGAEVGESAP